VDLTYPGVGIKEIWVTNEAVIVPPESRRTVDVNAVLPKGRDAGARVSVRSGPDVVAERVMYFHADPGLGHIADDGSVAPGAQSGAREWLFAEGTTRPGYQEYLTIANPSTAPASVEVTYPGAPGTSSQVSVPGGQRATIDVNRAVGSGRDVGARVVVTAGPDVIAERPLYYTLGGDVALGVPAPQRSWLFAEGTTRAGFQEYLTIANPGAADAAVSVYVRVAPGQGSPVAQAVTVPAGGRVTVDVNALAGPDKDVGLVVTSTNDVPVLAERPLYFTAPYAGGSVATGIAPG
jgi:hypothetical protein